MHGASSIECSDRRIAIRPTLILLAWSGLRAQIAPRKLFGGIIWPNFRLRPPRLDRLLSMTDRDTGITVEMLDAHSESDGWAVVYRVAGMPRTIVGVYLTRAHAEAAAERIQKQVGSYAETLGTALSHFKI